MAREWRTGGSVELIIDAAPDEVYRTISDVTSTGDRSGECRSAEWMPGSAARPVVGARFRGRNRSGVPVVRHSYEITRMPRAPFKAVYGVLLPQHRDMRPAMQETLQRLADGFALRPRGGG